MKARMAKIALFAYPMAYRRRYAEEIEALLEETEPRLLDVLDLLRGAVAAHLRPTGAMAACLPPEDRIRSSAVGILGSWIVFAFAGLAFYKTTEGSPFSHAADRHIALLASHGAIQALAAIATLIVVGAATPLIFAIVRAGFDSRSRSAVALAAGAVATFSVASLAVVAIANYANPLSDGAAAAIVVSWSAVAVGCAGACWFAARRGVFALGLGPAALRRTFDLGAGLAVAMAAIVFATGTYAISLAIVGNGLGGQPNGPLGLIDVGASIWIQLGLMSAATSTALVSLRRGRPARQIIG